MGLLQVERLQRDADPYTSYAMASLTSTIAAAVPVLLQKVCKCKLKGSSVKTFRKIFYLSRRQKIFLASQDVQNSAHSQLVSVSWKCLCRGSHAVAL